MSFKIPIPLWQGKHVQLVLDPEHNWLTVEKTDCLPHWHLHNPPQMPSGDWGTEHLGHFLYENWVQHSNHRLQRTEPAVWAEIVEELNKATLESLRIQKESANAPAEVG